jgi:hypothetical protein
MKQLSRKEAAAYLAGLLDGEGSVVYGRWGPKNKKQYRVVLLVNTDPTIVKAAEEAARILGYAFVTRSRESGPGRKRKYEVIVYRAEHIRRIGEELPIRAAHKKATLLEMIASFRTSKRPPEALLRRLYLKERLPVDEIWRKLGMSRPTLYRYLNYYGIQLREESRAVH